MNRKVFLTVELILALLTSFFVYEMFKEEPAQKRVAVIIEKSGDEKWDSFINGLKQSAKDNNIHLVICNTDEMENAAKERNIIEEQLNNDIDAFIIQPAPDEEINSTILELSNNMPVILTDSDLYARNNYNSTQKDLPVIAPSNYELGYRMGNEITNNYSAQIDNMRVGIICGKENMNSIETRKQGFIDSVSKEDLDIVWDIYQLEDIRYREPVDIIVALDTDVLEQLCESDLINTKITKIYGIGCSKMTVCCLDNGEIECLIMTDDFDMGYTCISEIKKKLDKKNYSIKEKDVEYKILYKDNIYSKENEAFLFSFER